MLFVLFAIMGLKALLFANKSKALKKQQEEIAREKLASLNEDLNKLYHELTVEQDTFEQKRTEHERAVEHLNCRRIEVQNRLDYLEGIKQKFAEKLKDQSTSLTDFKVMCESYLNTYNEIEVAKNDLHSAEVEFEASFQDWDETTQTHSNSTISIREKIETILSEISAMTSKKSESS